MIEFYVNVLFYWSALIIVLLVFVIRFQEDVQKLKQRKEVIVFGVLFYFFTILMIKFLDLGFWRPFLSEMNLDTLEVTRGVGIVTYNKGSNYLLSLNSHKTEYFDLSLCLPSIDGKELDNQHLVIWHKEKVVYKITKNDSTIFDLYDANDNVIKYNVLVVPLFYFYFMLVVFFGCLWIVS